LKAVDDADTTDKDTLFLLSGIALVIFGAGLILSNRTIRKYLGSASPGALLEVAAPSFTRYMKLRAM
jgi:hypothetical protein